MFSVDPVGGDIFKAFALKYDGPLAQWVEFLKVKFFLSFLTSSALKSNH